MPTFKKSHVFWQIYKETSWLEKSQIFTIKQADRETEKLRKLLKHNQTNNKYYIDILDLSFTYNFLSKRKNNEYTKRWSHDNFLGVFWVNLHFTRSEDHSKIPQDRHEISQVWIDRWMGVKPCIGDCLV
jgi:hypothetical protein